MSNNLFRKYFRPVFETFWLAWDFGRQAPTLRDQIVNKTLQEWEIALKSQFEKKL